MQLDEDGNILVALMRDGKVVGCQIEGDPGASHECAECSWEYCQIRGKEVLANGPANSE